MMPKGNMFYQFFTKWNHQMSGNRNSYEAAMIEHEKRFGQHSEKVKSWRSALSRVCDLSGEHCRDNMYESELIKKIVKDTSANLPPVPLQIKRIVGLDSRFEQVSKEIQRIQVVMPKTEIPEWFDCVCTEEIPFFWARRKFPIIALAFVFKEVKETDKFYNVALEFFPGVVNWHTVSLHLFIDGQEICSRDYHYFNVGEDHVLLCDLRVLFSDEEWQGLDTSLGDDWKTIQVQYDSDMILTNWGVYVYKQETNMDDIRFRLPNPNSSRGYVPSSRLVPKGSPDQKIRHVVESFNPRDIFNEHLPLLELEEIPARFTKVLLRSWRNAKAEIRDEASASAYGASLKQEHEESVEHVVRIVEMMKENVPKHIADSHHEYIQNFGRFVERLWRAQVELIKGEGQRCLGIGLDIILEYTDLEGVPSRRFWGTLEIKLGDPFFKAVFRRINQLMWRSRSSNEASSSAYRVATNSRAPIVLLECQSPSTEEASSSGYWESLEEGYQDPLLQELMRRIEEDAMSLNKSHWKLKASIVPMDDPISENYLLEALFIKRQQQLGKLGKLGSGFKITPYGKLRAKDDALALRILKAHMLDLTLILISQIIWLSFLGYVGLFFCRRPIMRKLLAWGWWLLKQILLLVCGWWLLKQILVPFKYLNLGIGKIMKIKEKKL